MTRPGRTGHSPAVIGLLAVAVGWAVLLVAVEPATWPAVGAALGLAGVLTAVALRAGDHRPDC